MGIISKTFGKKKETKQQIIAETRAAVLAEIAENEETSKKLIMKEFGDSQTIEKAALKYKQIVQHIDRMQVNGTFTISGLPYHSYEITNALYNNGMIAFVKNKLGFIEFAKVTPTGWAGMNRITTFQILQSRPNPLLDFGKTYINHVDGVLLYDNPEKIARIALIQPMLENMQQLFAKLGVNVVISGDKFIFQNIDIDNQEELENGVSSSFKTSKVTIAVDQLFQNKPPEVLSIDGRFMELWSAMKQWDVFRMYTGGFGNGQFGIDKKERLITNETESMEDGVDLIAATIINLWIEFVKEMKVIFGVNLKVRCKI